MSKRNALVILALSGLLFAFSVGVLVARPVGAQVKTSATWVGFLPHQSDLWQVRASDQNLKRYPAADGASVLGVGFTVATDSYGRLPVVTQILQRSGRFDSTDGRLYRLDPDGTYHKYATVTPPCSNAGIPAMQGGVALSPGVLLEPGAYFVEVVSTDGQDATDQARAVVISGYCALP